MFQEQYKKCAGSESESHLSPLMHFRPLKPMNLINTFDGLSCVVTMLSVSFVHYAHEPYHDV